MQDPLDVIKNTEVRFGLVQQGHIPVIESMLSEGSTWPKIANKIGWVTETAELWYLRYKQKTSVTEQQIKNMQHAVGFFSDTPGYRNGYCVPVAKCFSWEDLVQRGYASRGRDINQGRDRCYLVTEEGKQLIGFHSQVQLADRNKRSKRRTALYYLQNLVQCGAYTADEVEFHGFTMDEVQDYAPMD